MNRGAIAVVVLCIASLFAAERPASKIVSDPLTRARTPPHSREIFPADDGEQDEVVRDGRSSTSKATSAESQKDVLRTIYAGTA